MNRFFIDPALITGSSITVPNDVSSQIRKVLRLKDGAKVRFLDNQGWSYLSEIHYVSEKEIQADVLEKSKATGEPDCKVTLYISLTQRDKFEWILQKCTEAGVSRIIPMITERTLIRKVSDISGKQQRWEAILREAAEQCGRGLIPKLLPTISITQAQNENDQYDTALFCWETEKNNTFRKFLNSQESSIRNVAIMIGPEGGFSEEEAANVIAHNWNPVTLGNRIYRMETAALVAIVLTLYEIENDNA